MRKLGTVLIGVSFLVTLGLGVSLATERHRGSERVRPVGSDLLHSDTREAAVISRPGGLSAAAIELSEDVSLARVVADERSAAQSQRGLAVQALSSDDLMTNELVGHPEVARKLGLAEGKRNLQVQPLSNSVPASQLTSPDAEE